MRLYYLLIGLSAITSIAALNHVDIYFGCNGGMSVEDLASISDCFNDSEMDDVEVEDKSCDRKYPRNQDGGVIEICSVDFLPDPHGVLEDNRPCVICSPEHPPCYCDEIWHCNYIAQTCRSCPTYICLGKNGEIIENGNYTIPFTDITVIEPAASNIDVILSGND